MDATVFPDVHLSQKDLLILVGALIGVLVLLCISYCCCYRRKKKTKPQEVIIVEEIQVETFSEPPKRVSSQKRSTPQQTKAPQNQKPKSVKKKSKSKKPKKDAGDELPVNKDLAAGVVVPGTYEDIVEVPVGKPDKKQQQKGADKGGNKKEAADDIYN
uniref:Candidate secreted effector n=1 Tax=Meloidogyne incognita TaxID=6306 RepID=A0A914MDA1_MELIC